MTNMNVLVPDVLEDWVKSRVDSGQYASASDYVRALIVKDRDSMTPLDVAAIRRSIEQGRATAGPVRDADQVFDMLEARLRHSASRR